jgi:N-acetylmuramoyl-L-alanine amidase
MTQQPTRSTRRQDHVQRFTVAAIGAVWILTGAMVSAQSTTAKALYQRATDREAALRANTQPTAKDMQSAIGAYELVVRRFPSSGYSDNALWQAAGIALMAFEKTGDAADKANGEHLLSQLESSYPRSSLIKQIPDRRREFSAAPPVAPAPVPSGAGAVLRSITRESLPGGDRIILEVDREVLFTSDRIANPDRVWIDLASTSVGTGVSAQAGSVKGMMITGVRLGKPAAGTTRIVLDLAGMPKHSIYPLYSPYRLVIDAEGPVPPPLTKTVVQESPVNVLKSTGPSEPSRSIEPSGSPEPSRSSERSKAPEPPKVNLNLPVSVALPPSLTKGGDYSLARQLGLGVQRIVIDAGHGGHDPGAQGNGIVEKDLVLDVALRLQTLLQEQPGVEVVLTRDSDVFIPLEERTAIANRAGADLFLSIHANASTRKDARGLETYFLNFATNPEAEAVAARENAASNQAMGHLPEIVKAITLNNKLAESRELATTVQTQMMRKLKPQNANLRDLGVKQAPFVVLIGAQMPSVLAEISFLTNRGEATLLKQSAYKNRIAQALCDAILKYQTSLKKVTTVAAKNEHPK